MPGKRHHNDWRCLRLSNRIMTEGVWGCLISHTCCFTFCGTSETLRFICFSLLLCLVMVLKHLGCWLVLRAVTQLYLQDSTKQGSYLALKRHDFKERTRGPSLALSFSCLRPLLQAAQHAVLCPTCSSSVWGCQASGAECLAGPVWSPHCTHSLHPAHSTVILQLHPLSVWQTPCWIWGTANPGYNMLCHFCGKIPTHKLWIIAVTLTLNTAIQYFHWILWLIKICHQTSFGSKRIISSADTVEMVIFWSLWLWPWTQKPFLLLFCVTLWLKMKHRHAEFRYKIEKFRKYFLDEVWWHGHGIDGQTAAWIQWFQNISIT